MNKKVIYSLGIIVIVVLVIVISEQLSNRTPPEHELQFFPGISETSISAVMINQKDKTLKLSKDGAQWYIQSIPKQQDSEKAFSEDSDAGKTTKYLADSASVQIALEKIVNLKKSMLVSENPERQEAFEVDTASGIMIDVLDKNSSSLGTFILGKSGADFNSHYVRQMGSNSVYSAPGGVRHSLFTDINRWRDRKITSFSADLVYKIDLSNKDGSGYTLERTEQGWRITAPVEHYANQDTVGSIIATLSNFSTADFENNQTNYDSLGLTEPQMTVSVDLTDGTQRKISIGAQNDKNQYWTMAEHRDDIFLISKSNLDKINKDLENLKGEEPEATEIIQNSEE